jgi:hypothetical protein
VRPPGDHGPVRPPAEPDASAQVVVDRAAAVGNERLTALAGAALLVLIGVELVSVPSLHALLSVHVFVGVLMAAPLAVKLASTGYRFVRYYRGSPAYVRKGPPRPTLRVLAPLLVVATLTLLGSGIGLLVTGPSKPGPLIFVHGISTLLWLPLIAIHVFAYIRRVPGLVADEWRLPPAVPAPGGNLRLLVNLGALAAGAIAAVLVLPTAAPWTVWIKTSEGGVPGPFIVGMVFAALALLATRPLRWG